jgi:hypothetical protein
VARPIITEAAVVRKAARPCEQTVCGVADCAVGKPPCPILRADFKSSKTAHKQGETAHLGIARGLFSVEISPGSIAIER